ncbi:MAG: sigma 54-interacting transcriptional regulator [Kiritimatiellia bacterium]
MEKNNSDRKIDTPTLVVARPGGKSLRVQQTRLLVAAGPLKGREFTMDKELFTIGSDPHCDLVLDDGTVSRRHCELEMSSEGYLIRDLGSTNGTIIHGIKIKEAVLGQETEFRLGNSRIIFSPLGATTEYVLSDSSSFGALLGESMVMKHVFHLAEKYAPTDATVLIQGETGTGKEVLAEELHRHSKRKDKPFIVIDCAALTRELVASELFGHTKGAFTGADTDREGAFEHANGGTVFLDEIGDLDPDLQPKLLRVLEKRQIKRIGSNEVKNVDVRIICSTNKRLETEVNARRFREDLFYRLSVAHIDLPPLRKRKGDIALLVKSFLKSFLGPEAPDKVMDFEKTIDTFKRYDWPGNVRELRNLIEMAAVGRGEGEIDLSSFLYPNRIRVQTGPADDFGADKPFKAAKNRLIKDFEISYIRDLLEKFNGNVARAARHAEIERAYLQRLIKKHGLRD